MGRGIKSVVLVSLLGLALAAVGAQAGARASSTLRSCGSVFSGPDEPGFGLRAKGISCRTARLRAARLIRAGSCGGTGTCRSDGYFCRRRRTVDLLYRVGCYRPSAYFSYGGGS